MPAAAVFVAAVGFPAPKRLVCGRLRLLPCPVTAAASASAGTDEGVCEGYRGLSTLFPLFSQQF